MCVCVCICVSSYPFVHLCRVSELACTSALPTPAFSNCQSPGSSFLISQTHMFLQDSYLNPYFSEMNEYLHIGPPVYFVIEEGFNYSDFANQNKVRVSL